ncbi:hypothetical protein BDR22DRAFT_823820 [Usnea florida]
MVCPIEASVVDLRCIRVHCAPCEEDVWFSPGSDSSHSKSPPIGTVARKHGLVAFAESLRGKASMNWSGLCEKAKAFVQQLKAAFMYLSIWYVPQSRGTTFAPYLHKAVYPSMKGYAKLASLMGAHPEVAIFRRFGTSNALNLLYLQAEIVALERDLRTYTTADDSSSDPSRAIHSRDWYTLSQSSNSGGDVDAAVFHQTHITALPNPNPRDLAFLQQWMKRPSMGDVYLLGRDSDIWSKPDTSDLIALNARTAEDAFTTWVADRAVHWWHRSIGRFLRPAVPEYSANTVSYSSAGLLRLTSIISVILASLLPTAAIIVLYYINSDLLRLIMIGIFTAVFTTTLALVTNARTVDIFTATAAWVHRGDDETIMSVMTDTSRKIYGCAGCFRGYQWESRVWDLIGERSELDLCSIRLYDMRRCVMILLTNTNPQKTDS